MLRVALAFWLVVGSTSVALAGGEGAFCWAGDPCSSGLTCDVLSGFKCRRPGIAGEGCHATRPCANGLVCSVLDGWTCRSPSAAECIDDSGCPAGTRCHPTSKRCVLVPTLDLAARFRDMSPETIDETWQEIAAVACPEDTRVSAVGQLLAGAQRTVVTFGAVLQASVPNPLVMNTAATGSISVGVAFSPGGPWGCFLQMCAGMTLGGGASVGFTAGWQFDSNIDSVAGRSLVMGGAVEIPFANVLGVNGALSFAPELPGAVLQRPFDYSRLVPTGATVGMSIGVGAPASGDLLMCSTWLARREGNTGYIPPQEWRKPAIYGLPLDAYTPVTPAMLADPRNVQLDPHEQRRWRVTPGWKSAVSVFNADGTLADILFAQVFGGKGGAFYGVKSDGRLFSIRPDGGGTMRMTQVKGENFRDFISTLDNPMAEKRSIFGGVDNLIYARDAAGKLYWFKHDPVANTITARVQIGDFSEYNLVFGGWDGHIWGLKWSEGDLYGWKKDLDWSKPTAWTVSRRHLPQTSHAYGWNKCRWITAADHGTVFCTARDLRAPAEAYGLYMIDPTPGDALDLRWANRVQIGGEAFKDVAPFGGFAAGVRMCNPSTPGSFSVPAGDRLLYFYATDFQSANTPRPRSITIEAPASEAARCDDWLPAAVVNGTYRLKHRATGHYLTVDPFKGLTWARSRHAYTPFTISTPRASELVSVRTGLPLRGNGSGLYVGSGSSDKLALRFVPGTNADDRRALRGLAIERAISYEALVRDGDRSRWARLQDANGNLAATAIDATNATFDLEPVDPIPAPAPAPRSIRLVQGNNCVYVHVQGVVFKLRHAPCDRVTNPANQQWLTEDGAFWENTAEYGDTGFYLRNAGDRRCLAFTGSEVDCGDPSLSPRQRCGPNYFTCDHAGVKPVFLRRVPGGTNRWSVEILGAHSKKWCLRTDADATLAWKGVCGTPDAASTWSIEEVVTGRVGQIRWASNGDCLGVRGADDHGAEGGPAELGSCVASPRLDANWQVRPVVEAGAPTPYVQIVNALKGLCLEVDGLDRHTEGAGVGLIPCDGGGAVNLDSHWGIRPVRGQVQIINRVSRRCLVIDGTTVGSRATLRGCDDRDVATRWVIQASAIVPPPAPPPAPPPLPSGTRTAPIVNGSGKCIDSHWPHHNAKLDGGRIQAWTCNGGDNQKWKLDRGRLVNPNGTCLEVPRVHFLAGQDGGAVQQWTCNGSDQQQWSFVGDTLRSRNGKCLGYTPMATTNQMSERNPDTDGAELEIRTCDGSLYQRWTQ